MTKRREFSQSVKIAIVKRAMRGNVIYCEQCGHPAKQYDIDHIVAEELRVDKSKPLTADEGQLLCSGSRDTCHGRKTADHDVPVISKAKRNEASALRVRTKSKTPMPCGKNSKYKRTMDGRVVLREKR